MVCAEDIVLLLVRDPEGRVPRIGFEDDCLRRGNDVDDRVAHRPPAVGTDRIGDVGKSIRGQAVFDRVRVGGQEGKNASPCTIDGVRPTEIQYQLFGPC